MKNHSEYANLLLDLLGDEVSINRGDASFYFNFEKSDVVYHKKTSNYMDADLFKSIIRDVLGIDFRNIGGVHIKPNHIKFDSIIFERDFIFPPIVNFDVTYLSIDCVDSGSFVVSAGENVKLNTVFIHGGGENCVVDIDIDQPIKLKMNDCLTNNIEVHLNKTNVSWFEPPNVCVVDNAVDVDKPVIVKCKIHGGKFRKTTWPLGKIARKYMSIDEVDIDPNNMNDAPVNLKSRYALEFFGSHFEINHNMMSVNCFVKDSIVERIDCDENDTITTRFEGIGEMRDTVFNSISDILYFSSNITYGGPIIDGFNICFVDSDSKGVDFRNIEIIDGKSQIGDRSRFHMCSFSNIERIDGCDVDLRSTEHTGVSKIVNCRAINSSKIRVHLELFPSVSASRTYFGNFGQFTEPMKRLSGLCDTYYFLLGKELGKAHMERETIIDELKERIFNEIIETDI